MDVDEHLYLPARHNNINSLLDELEKNSATAYRTIMLDQYSLGNPDGLKNKNLQKDYPAYDGAGYVWHKMLYPPFFTVTGGPRVRLLKNSKDQKHIAMQKSPLIYWEDGKAFLNSTHVVNFSTFTNEIGILSHFKFMSDFHES